MYIPQKRALSHKDSIFIICAACIIFVVASCVCSYFGARWLRQRHYNPKYIPGQFLKGKWKQWCPGSAAYGQVPNPRAQNADDTTYHGAGGAPEMTTVNIAGVQRETSVRSIMTLPPYSVSPKDSEQVVAREGERGGMDMVVEFPETVDEQEARREDQMESLYQLRLQRRQEIADREARRQERRDARARGDAVRLEQLAAESRARNNARNANASNTSISATAVIAEHRSRERDRRISSVSYASIGRVRHDGSRLRADSHDSDHQPLLPNAVVDSASPSLMDPPTSMCSRVQSTASSIMTASTSLTEADPLVLRPTSTHRSSRPTSMHFSSRPVSVIQPDEGDLGTLNIPPPPDYEHLDWGDAPAYESQTLERHTSSGRQLPELSRLSSIHINVSSPIAVSPVSPVTTISHRDELDRDPPTPPTPTGPIPAVVSTGSTTGHAPVS